MLTCLHICLPDVPWLSPSEGCTTLYNVYNLETPGSAYTEQVEQLLMYTFKAKTLLLEALSHQSYRAPTGGASYERLEFLGDSILDQIVTRTAFGQEPPIPTPRLHLVRTALVNGNFLGWLCLSCSMFLSRAEPVIQGPRNVTTIEVSHQFYLWQAMRHASPHMAAEQKACLERVNHLGGTIEGLLTDGSHYPWTALAQLEPPKPLSDIVESLLGAIYIDSGGSWSACEAFLERLGLMSYLCRVLCNDIALLHPKEELGHLADRQNVKYEMSKEGEEGKQQLTCSVSVGKHGVVSVGGGRSIMETQTRAAEAACQSLKQSSIWQPHDSVGGNGKEAVAEPQGLGEAAMQNESWSTTVREDNDNYDSDVYMTADES